MMLKLRLGGSWCNCDFSPTYRQLNICGCKCKLPSRTFALPFIIRGMSLVVFLRGVNVGGHRTFRPSILARELSAYGVLNVGAAGTFVVRKPGPRA